MHFAHLSNALLKVHETTTFVLVTLPNIHRFKKFMQKGHCTEAMQAIAITAVATCYAAAVGGIKQYRDPSVSLSVCLSQPRL